MQTETATTTIHAGELLIHTTVTTKVESARVDFDDILVAVEVSADDSMIGETPWDWCDGFTHTASRLSRFHEGRETVDQRRGYCYSEGDREHIVITVQWDNDLYHWYRRKGTSRQVAQEMVALSLRKRLDRLVKWYTHGWEWWFCGGEHKDCADGVGGIDDYGYAYNEVRRECAENIAQQLEQAGYIVINKPTPDPTVARRQKRDRIRYNRTLFSWED